MKLEDKHVKRLWTPHMTRLVFSWVNVKVEQLDHFSFSCCNIHVADQASLITSCILVESVNRWKPEEHQSPQWWSSITSLLVVWGHSEQQVGGFNLAGYHPKFFKLKAACYNVHFFCCPVLLHYPTCSLCTQLGSVAFIFSQCEWSWTTFQNLWPFLFCCYRDTIFFNVCE